MTIFQDRDFGHLRSPKSSFRLNQIEKIRADGVGELVALPQLVVCGDQSAGKSSVLEGITQIPFPRQEGLCTRFPTEIILRNSMSESTTVSASVRPHASRPADVQERLLSFRKTIEDMSELPAATQEVSKLMNIRGYTEDGDGCAFAPDALRVEVTGPIGLHLSVVDLPGLISVANEEQSEEDIDAVYDMVNAYLQSSRTIILAVLQASNDIANQGIIKLARKHDPEGQRTVGIITKADLINKGAESRIALLARNEDTIKLKLGFFLVKNPSPQEIETEITMETRLRREIQFFSTELWKAQQLDMSRIGTDKLRLFLQDLLDTHIERELPKVQEEIKKTLANREAELTSLGDARPTLGHIRSFMTSLSMKFYQLLQAALDGNYASIDVGFFSRNDSSRLRACAQKKSTSFANYMREHGEKRKVGNPEPPEVDGDSTNEADQIILTKEEMMEWVEKVYVRARGRELPGNFNSALLSELFYEQSGRWGRIATDHLQDILNLVSRWLDQASRAIILEERMRAEAQRVLRDWLGRAEGHAMQELARLLQDERRSPLTYNHYYTDNVQKDRLAGQRAAIKAAIALTTEHDWNGRLHISNITEDFQKFMAATEAKITVNMEEQACKEALTQLKAYYKVSMKTFVDNVARQVIERHVLSTLPGAFCPESVASLSDEDMWRIGSEPENQTSRRNRLNGEAEGLRRSLQELQRTA